MTFLNVSCVTRYAPLRESKRLPAAPSKERKTNINRVIPWRMVRSGKINGWSQRGNDSRVYRLCVCLTLRVTSRWLNFCCNGPSGCGQRSSPSDEILDDLRNLREELGEREKRSERVNSKLIYHAGDGWAFDHSRWRRSLANRNQDQRANVYTCISSTNTFNEWK